MIYTLRILLLVAIGFLSWGCDIENTQESCGAPEMEYLYPSRNTNGYVFSRHGWFSLVDVTAVEHSSLARPNSPVRQTSFISPIKECSTVDYRCVRTSELVMAVPRSGTVRPGMSYSVEGARHHVIGCYDLPGEQCRIFMAYSECTSEIGRRAVDESGKIVGKDCRSSGWGKNALFIFDKERGVVAFDLGTEGPPDNFDPRGDLSTLGRTASIMALTGKRGLLSCKF